MLNQCLNNYFSEFGVTKNFIFLGIKKSVFQKHMFNVQ